MAILLDVGGSGRTAVRLTCQYYRQVNLGRFLIVRREI
jgi:hypothetical protein